MRKDWRGKKIKKRSIRKTERGGLSGKRLFDKGQFPQDCAFQGFATYALGKEDQKADQTFIWGRGKFTSNPWVPTQNK